MRLAVSDRAFVLVDRALGAVGPGGDPCGCCGGGETGCCYCSDVGARRDPLYCSGVVGCNLDVCHGEGRCCVGRRFRFTLDGSGSVSSSDTGVGVTKTGVFRTKIVVVVNTKDLGGGACKAEIESWDELTATLDIEDSRGTSFDVHRDYSGTTDPLFGERILSGFAAAFPPFHTFVFTDFWGASGFLPGIGGPTELVGTEPSRVWLDPLLSCSGSYTYEDHSSDDRIARWGWTASQGCMSGSASVRWSGEIASTGGTVVWTYEMDGSSAVEVIDECDAALLPPPTGELVSIGPGGAL